MIGYATIGVKDVKKATAFYMEIFADKGAKVMADLERICFISVARGQPMLAVCEPYDKSDPQPGNGTMLAFTAKDKPDVEKMYAHALKLGATCDGPPGQRVPDTFYGAYLRDPDGNKICFFVFA